MTRAFLFLELVRLRRLHYPPLYGCFGLLCFAATGRLLGGAAAIVGPCCGLLMLALAMPALAPNPAYPFLRSATRLRILTTGWITAATWGAAMLLPAALLATFWTAAAWSRTELLLAGTTFVLGLNVRVPASSGHAARRTPVLPVVLALSFYPGMIALFRGPGSDPQAYAMLAIWLDLFFIPICAFLTARAWRRADL